MMITHLTDSICYKFSVDVIVWCLR